MGMVKRKIGDILTLQRGYDLPASKMEGGNVAVVGSNGIIGYHNIVKYDAPCIIVGRSGSVGKVRYYSIPTWPHNTALFVKDFKGNDPLYLYYFLKNLHLDEKFSKSSSVVPSLDRNIVHSLHVQFQEDINEQKNIAKILSAFDIKIALNRQINDNLDAMARQLYDYWFVQFDFPDENGRPYKSSGGKMVWNEKLKREIPEGWETSKIKDIAQTYSGGTPKSSNSGFYKSGDIPWVNSGELNKTIITSTHNYITQLGLDSSSAKKYPKGTILIALYGATAGKVSYLSFEACSNQAVCGVMTYNKALTDYVRLYLSSLYEHFVTLSTGSARSNISQETVKDTLLFYPVTSSLQCLIELVII